MGARDKVEDSSDDDEVLDLFPGQTVKVVSHVTQPRLNGLLGKITRFDAARKCWEVTMYDPKFGKVLLSQMHMEPAAAPAPAPAPAPSSTSRAVAPDKNRSVNESSRSKASESSRDAKLSAPVRSPAAVRSEETRVADRVQPAAKMPVAQGQFKSREQQLKAGLRVQIKDASSHAPCDPKYIDCWGTLVARTSTADGIWRVALDSGAEVTFSAKQLRLPLTLKPGVCVLIGGLGSGDSDNGKEGVLETFVLTSGTWSVRIDDRRRNMRPENLEPVDTILRPGVYATLQGIRDNPSLDGAVALCHSWDSSLGQGVAVVLRTGETQHVSTENMLLLDGLEALPSPSQDLEGQDDSAIQSLEALLCSGELQWEDY